MRTADIESGSIVHRLHITYGGTRTCVDVGCDHGDAEEVLAVLSHIELNCEWPAAVLQHLLRRRVPLSQACAWARLPVTPKQVHWYALWKGPHIKRPWALEDLERWRKQGRSPQQAAEFCARYPHRVDYPEGPL